LYKLILAVVVDHHRTLFLVRGCP